MASKEEVTAIAEEVAERTSQQTLHETFRLFGVDLADQKQVNEFREDLVHARKLRRLSQRVGGLVLLALVPFIVLLVFKWAGVGLIDLLKSKLVN